MTPRYRIVGTAGHIDHGKSALVRALTGVDPDRLKEEKARGITIDLGFADLALDPARVLSFVDVPGHERFVRHMVAGAAGIDAVLLVIAADDGVRPQTREHLDICTLLGVEHGVVAMSKSDLVDPELTAVASMEVREFLTGSFLEGAPVVAVSARTGDGLDALRGALDALFERVPDRATGGITRLPVDRSFVLRGFGTVVTGTLVSGRLAEGDDVEVQPGGRRGRVRGVQVHRLKVAEARAGQRTAVNVQGLDRDAIPRGSTLGHPGTLLTTDRILARIRLLPGAPRALARGGRVRFHQGTCERGARMRTLRTESDGAWTVEIRLDEDTVVLPGDRFILRRPAPVDTVGGGTVLDARPPRARSAVLLRQIDREREDSVDPVVVRLARAGLAGRDRPGLASELGWSPVQLANRLESLEGAAKVVEAAGLVFDRSAWDGLSTAVSGELASFHRAEPLRPGMSREELRGRVAREMPQEAWRAWLAAAAADGVVDLAGERVSASGHRVELSREDRETSARIVARFRERGLDPPALADVLREVDAGERAERIVALMVEDGVLVRLGDGRLFDGEALAALRERLREHARTSPTIDVGTFKKLAGVTRKNAIPLLEYLDAQRFTRRVGNRREILGG